MLLLGFVLTLFAVAFWSAFYNENQRFELDTLEVASRFPTQTSKTNDFRGPFDESTPVPPGTQTWGVTLIAIATLCYAMVLLGRKSGIRAAFRPDSIREGINIGPPAGLRPAGGPILMHSRIESGRNPARKLDFRPGGTIAQHRVVYSPWVSLRRCCICCFVSPGGAVGLEGPQGVGHFALF